jgi:PKD repeat protein
VEFDGSLSHHTDPTKQIEEYEWDFGDGIGTSDEITTTYEYGDFGQYLITLTVSDGELSDTDTVLLYISDVPPELGPISVSDNLLEVNVEPVEAWATFDDPCVPHSAVWDWGDGHLTEQDPVTSPITATHIYNEPGVYEVILTLTDSKGQSDTSVYQYVVVYDPEGGFVTGGGWIYSAAGSYIPDDTLEGMANFGFVSKYKKGANVPTGQTEFQFHVADLNFHSSEYDWLVVNQNGTNAQFKGSGTINGDPSPTGEDFKFMLWAGDKNPDTFRIKIWYEEDGEVVVYDNGFEQEIESGSIVIHKAK